MTKASLLASNTRFPNWAARNVGKSPAAPTMAAMTVSHSLSATAAISPSWPNNTVVAEPLSRKSAERA